jgi:hypothetical protein
MWWSSTVNNQETIREHLWCICVQHQIRHGKIITDQETVASLHGYLTWYFFAVKTIPGTWNKYQQVSTQAVCFLVWGEHETDSLVELRLKTDSVGGAKIYLEKCLVKLILLLCQMFGMSFHIWLVRMYKFYVPHQII